MLQSESVRPSSSFEYDSLAGESLHETLHASTETKNEMETRVLLDVTAVECANVLELLASEDQVLTSSSGGSPYS
ncbi:hypothetical protein BD410DRAFT_793048 [Rickenella mellea]|uniref:Uncharacterized protein n=1 Tax=Rickenella mellea TaxID=50990 RepID=A0A4Y7PVN9_9AGAM|nr:hypothetical protein BD410DRAFT_793048 [Rickenella mellea]